MRLSAAVAISAPEWMRPPTFLLNRAIQSFTRIEAASTPTVTQLKVTGVGARILPRLVFPNSSPITSTITATARPDRYSNRACP